MNRASETNSQNRNYGTTLAQRAALVAAYQRLGNMTAAMQEAGIRSPRTAYLWWRRYQEAGGAGLIPRSRARKSQRTVPEDVVRLITELKDAHPDWGRRRIAHEIALRLGPKAVSPSGVQAVLQRAGKWHPALSSPAPSPTTERRQRFVSAAMAELDTLLPLVVSGIEVSLRSHAAQSVAILGDQVWNQLGRDRQRWTRFLNDPAIGPLLLRSRVELGRSLMNTGQWREAGRFLEETLGWLQRATPERGEPDTPDPALGISLRRADAWLETYQYLGIVLQERTPDIAQGHLQNALSAIKSSAKRLVPLHPRLIEGNLERDLARHLLRQGDRAESEITRHFHASRAALEDADDQAMLAATDMVWANLQSRQAARFRDRDRAAWIAAIEAMEAAIERALSVFEPIDSPMLRALFLIDAAQLFVAHALPLDRRRLQQAAEYCLAFGYGGQARRLIDTPDISGLLMPDVLQSLTEVASRGESPATQPHQRPGNAW